MNPFYSYGLAGFTGSKVFLFGYRHKLTAKGDRRSYGGCVSGVGFRMQHIHRGRMCGGGELYIRIIDIEKVEIYKHQVQHRI